MWVLPAYSAVFVIVACSGASDRTQSNDAARAASTVAMQDQRPDSLGRLIQGLRKLPGSFVPAGRRGQWEFTGSKEYLDAIADFGDSAVVRLTDCLSDTSAAQARVRGRAAPFGVLCYEALVHTAYYEAYEDRPEGPNKYSRWAGEVEPTASAAALRRAQEAWRAVIRAKKYHLL